MKIAVIHHRLRTDAAADADVLVGAVGEACSEGAHAVVCPRLPTLAGLDPADRDELLGRIEGCAGGAAVFISFAEDAGEPLIVQTPLGATALLGGDACLREDVLRSLVAERIDTAIWRPGAESELQAEAIIEYALGCSPALAGLLLVAECSDGEPHQGSSGTSAIIQAGELLAESTASGDEILFAEVEVPLGAPEPHMPLPELPPILVQRLAVHEGRKPEVDYPADLS